MYIGGGGGWPGWAGMVLRWLHTDALHGWRGRQRRFAVAGSLQYAEYAEIEAGNVLRFLQGQDVFVIEAFEAPKDMFLVLGPQPTPRDPSRLGVGLVSAHCLEECAQLGRVDYLRDLVGTATGKDDGGDQLVALQDALLTLLMFFVGLGGILGYSSNVMGSSSGYVVPWTMVLGALQVSLLMAGYLALSRVELWLDSPTVSVFGRSSGDRGLALTAILAGILAFLFTIFALGVQLDTGGTQAPWASVFLWARFYLALILGLFPLFRLGWHETDSLVLPMRKIAWLYFGVPWSILFALWVFFTRLAWALDGRDIEWHLVFAPLVALQVLAALFQILHALFGRALSFVKFVAYALDRGALLHGVPDFRTEGVRSASRIASVYASLIGWELLLCASLQLPWLESEYGLSPARVGFLGALALLVWLGRSVFVLCKAVSSLSQDWS